jgi:hypothetical protein
MTKTAGLRQWLIRLSEQRQKPFRFHWLYFHMKAVFAA